MEREAREYLRVAVPGELDYGQTRDAKLEGRGMARDAVEENTRGTLHRLRENAAAKQRAR